MKKLCFFVSVLAAVFFTGRASCLAAYVIHLKSGGQFVTYNYWQEGDQIKFYKYGGEVGVAADFVREIEEVDESRVADEEASVVLNSQPREDTIEQNPAAEANGTTSESKLDRQKITQKKAKLVQEREELNAAFKRAKAAGRNEEKQKYWKELRDVQNRLSELRAEVRERNQGELPAWWSD